MGFLLNKLAAEWPQIAASPFTFVVTAVSLAIVLGLAIWALLHFVFKTLSANLRAALDTKDAHIRLIERELEIERNARKTALEQKPDDDFMPVVGMILQSSEPAIREMFVSLGQGARIELADDPRENPEQWQRRDEADLKLAAVVRHLADLGAATIEKHGEHYVVIGTAIARSSVAAPANTRAKEKGQ
jgi:hypothetical protein